MASSIENVFAANDMSAALAAAGSNATAGGELMLASGTVIAFRAAMGVRAMADPATADHGELALLLPEKSAAVSAASVILLQQASEAAHRAARFALAELSAAADATTELTACTDPAALAALQGTLALAALGRVMAQSIATATLAIAAQQAAMAPFHQAATANAKRLTTTF